MDHKFQINLRGLIDLLSNHLYSEPDVFVRELLQNGTDAIRARGYLEPAFRGEMVIDVHRKPGKPPTLAFTDNGVGLTEDEVHKFLATIGETSKRAAQWDRPVDFIGQFGIGLLSCFVVSDEIVVVTRSARAETHPPLEWRGRPDGTYSLKTIDAQIAPGTQVYLTCKKGCEEQFDADRIRERVAHYGLLLPFAIRVTAGKRTDVVNADGAPWRQEFKSDKQRAKALLEFGEQAFGVRFFDAVPLRSRVGGVDGVAFILPFTPNLATKQSHRVYLKNMLLSEKADNLLPDWAFFVKAIVNANDLRPTASRESFYEDEKLEAARVALGECLRQYLVDLAEREKVERDPSAPRDSGKLEKFIRLHNLAIKTLAVQDDEFYKLFIHWLRFETSKGDVTLGEYRDHNDVIRFVPDVDQFRQLSAVARAQNLWVLNGGYVHDADLLAKYADVFDGVTVETLDPKTLSQSFDDPTEQEQGQAGHFLDVADAALQPYHCAADVKKFLPHDLPALYSTDLEGRLLREWERSKDVATPLWSGVLDNIRRRERRQGTATQLVFNLNNPLVRRLVGLPDRAVVRRAVQMLYVQALLLGHHPLSPKEMAVLNDGLLSMIEWGIELREKGNAE